MTGGSDVVSADTPEPPVGQALEELGRLALREHSMESLMQRVVDLTKVIMPGHGEASISRVVNGRPSTAVFTGQLALDCDESQYGRGDGPCLQAARTGEYVEIADARVETRFGDYAQDLADNLQTAIESRAVIDQAKGILMERHKLTADQAFQVLARISMQTNTKLRVVSDQLVTTGQLPGIPR